VYPDIIAEIVVEHLDPNSDQYHLLSLCVADHGMTTVGATIAIIETTKTVFEVESPADGRLFFAPGLETATVVQAGQLLAVVARPEATDEQILPRWSSERRSTEAEDPLVQGATFSKAASRRMRALGLPPEPFVGRGLVTASDVQAYFDEQSNKKRQKP